MFDGINTLAIIQALLRAIAFVALAIWTIIDPFFPIDFESPVTEIGVFVVLAVGIWMAVEITRKRLLSRA